MRKNKTIISATLDGIPCNVRIETYYKQPPMPARIAPSDLDAEGYTELEYTFLDRKGYEAPWLQNKFDWLSEEKKEDFEIFLLEHLEGK